MLSTRATVLRVLLAGEGDEGLEEEEGRAGKVATAWHTLGQRRGPRRPGASLWRRRGLPASTELLGAAGR